jgi:hypothetical protein
MLISPNLKSSINKTKLIKMVIAIATIAITIINITLYDNFTVIAQKESRYSNFGTILAQGQNQNQNPGLPIDQGTNSSIKNNENMVIKQPNLNNGNLDSFFTQAPLSKEIISRITGESFVENDEINLNQLRYLKILFYGFDGETKIGELIVNEKIAQDVLGIFKDLYLAKYPIEKIRLIDDYNASDLSSMEDNNTSAFCYREITGGGGISEHALGLAIDINPVQNPYLIMKSGLDNQVLPISGTPNLVRDKNIQGLITKDDACYKAFIKRGWKWGGEWENPIDYQHFYKEITE